MPSLVVAALLNAWILADAGVSVQRLTVWFALVVCASIAVALFEGYVTRTGLCLQNAKRFLWIRIFLGALPAVLYGAAAFMLPADVSQKSYMFIYILLSAMMSVGSLGFAALPAYYMMMDAVTLLPLTLLFCFRYATSGDIFFAMMAAICVVWQWTVLSKARRVSRTVVGAIEDGERLHDEIEEHKRARETIQHMAHHDALTHLANRRHFEETALRALQIAARDRARVGLIVLDLNDFKPVNDTFGHATGDQLLCVVAQRLRECLRASDFPARLGGDEFALLIQNVTSEHDLIEIEKKIGLAMAEPVVVESAQVHASAALGHALYPDDGGSLTELLRMADQRMYGDKRLRKREDSANQISV